MYSEWLWIITEIKDTNPLFNLGFRRLIRWVVDLAVCMNASGICSSEHNKQLQINN